MNYLFEKFIRFDNKISIVHNEKEYTYKDLLNKINEYEKILSSSIKDFSTIAILGDYSFENIALFLALWNRKNIIVPITSDVPSIIDMNLAESYCDYSIKTSNNNLDIKDLNNSLSHDMILTLQKSNHSGLVLFSSGSTGKPKAMIHNLDRLMGSYENKREKAMNMLVFLMFDHIGGLNTLFNVLSMGSSLIIPKTRDAKIICELIQNYKIRVLPSSPTFLNLILISGEYLNYDMKSLRMISYGTETMPQTLLLKLKNTFPKIKFLQTFGTSETGITNTSSKSSESLYMKLDSKEQEYKIIEGELYLRSKTQILGYLNASMDSFTKDGWFKTGDLVDVRDDYIKIIGRAKEVINVGGEKVLPAEVESVILEMENIEDCMAYAQNNAITGQSVIIDVVIKNQISQKELKKELRKFCQNKLERYKIPTKVNIVEKTNFSSRFKKIRIK